MVRIHHVGKLPGKPITNKL